MAYLSIDDLAVEYERGKPVLDNFSLAVAEGELVSLLGPSGCGKTTTLRSVAGFIQPQRGTITVDGQEYTRLPPNKRDIGLVFQSYALFPHLTVAQNVGFGLRMRGVKGAAHSQRIANALDLVDMADYADRRPAQLSGGQRQRVAVARAIVIEPKLLLLDEPLSNLDAKLRTTMRTELRLLQQRLGATMLYVTHDQLEALTLSDRIVVMNAGIIEQIGTPETIFQQPATPFVADFMGFENHFAVQPLPSSASQDHAESPNNGYQFQTIQAGAQTLTGLIRTETLAESSASMQQMVAYFRPEAATLHAAETVNSISGTVVLRTFRGSTIEYLVSTEIGELAVHAAEEVRYAQGDAVYIALKPESLLIMG